MRWQSLIPNVPPGTRALLIALVVVFLTVEIGTFWAGLPIAPYFMLVPGALTIEAAIAWPLHVLYTPARHGFAFILSLFFLAWMLGALEQRYGRAKVFQFTAFVSLFSGLFAWATGLLFASPPGFVITGSSVVALGAAALGTYIVRNEPEVYLFGAMRITPTQLFGFLFGMAVLNLVISRSFPHFVEELAAIGSGVLFGKWLESGRGAPRRAKPRTSKLRVVGGSDRTLH
jgi:hypothetical protein